MHGARLGGTVWRDSLSHSAAGPDLGGFLGSGGGPSLTQMNPFTEATKLVAAALIGLLITAVHQRLAGTEQPVSRSLAQAQVMLCVAGALMMIIIGNSAARALGIAGGASIVRFRTPVDDAKDTTILFLVLGLGMACGLGAIAAAGVGSAFVCLLMVMLDRVYAEHKPRIMTLVMVASVPEFPIEHLRTVLHRFGVYHYEPREVTHGDKPTVKYHVVLEPGVSLTHLSAQLMGDGTTIKSVSWEKSKQSA